MAYGISSILADFRDACTRLAEFHNVLVTLLGHVALSTPPRGLQ
ncbi:hypothetical protein [Mycobacteroides franklinii]